jgi:hypothetical protein
MTGLVPSVARLGELGSRARAEGLTPHKSPRSPSFS